MKNFDRAYYSSMKDYSQYVGLNVYDVIGEWVESPELTEFLKELQIELCKNLRRHFDNIAVISFKKIVEILQKYDYAYVEDVILAVKQFNAIDSSCLLLISLDVDANEDLSENKTLKFIKANYNDAYDNAYRIFSSIYNNKDAEGLTVFYRDAFDPADKFTCIYLNRNAADMKDTLEHELTHFVKRVAMHSNKFPRTYSMDIDNREKASMVSSALTKLFDAIGLKQSKIRDDVFKLAMSKMTIDEEHETLKSIVNAVIRRYERSDETFIIDHKQMNIRQIESLEDKDIAIKTRLQWLKAFLEEVNTFNFFKDKTDVFSEPTKERDFYLKCIMYICFKEIYSEYDIDKILEANFRKFRFRDL